MEYVMNEITVTGPEAEVKRFRDIEVIPPVGEEWGLISIKEDTPTRLVYVWLTKWIPVSDDCFKIATELPGLEIDVRCQGPGHDPWNGRCKWVKGKRVDIGELIDTYTAQVKGKLDLACTYVEEHYPNGAMFEVDHAFDNVPEEYRAEVLWESFEALVRAKECINRAFKN